MIGVNAQIHTRVSLTLLQQKNLNALHQTFMTYRLTGHFFLIKPPYL